MNIPAQVEKLNKAFPVENNIAVFKDALSKEDTSKAFNEILKAVSQLENNSDLQQKFFAYDTLASLLHDIRKYEKSIELNKKAAEYFLSAKNYDQLARIYWEISLNYSKKFEFSKANNYSKKIISLKDKLSRKQIVSSAYNDLGLLFWKIGELDSAVYFLEKSIVIAKNRDDSVSLGKRYNNLGVIYWRKGDIENAYKNYSESLFIREKLEDTTTVIKVLNNLALVFQRLKYYDLAESYIKRALALSEAINDPIGKSYSLRRLGNLLLELKQYQEAEKFLLESLDILYEIDDKISLVQVFNLLGNIYENTNNLDKAFNNYKRSVKLSYEINDKFSRALAYYNLGALTLSGKPYGDSYTYLQKSIQLSELYGYRVIKRDAYNKVAEYFQINNNKEQENNYLRKYIAINDSLFNEALISNISEVNTRNLIKTSEERRLLLQKENEIQRKEIDYQTQLIFSISILLTIIIALLVYSIYLYLKKNNLVKLIEQKNNELETANSTKDKLFSIIAHDLKGPFTSILGFSQLIYEEAQQNKHETIKEYSANLIKNLNRLIELINNLLNWSLIQRERIITSKEKFDLCNLISKVIEDIELNAELKKISFNKIIEEEIIINGDKQMLSSAIRNILSNSIKYSPIESSIDIKCFNKSNSVVVEIKDYGDGISQERIDEILENSNIESTLGTNNEKGTGIGLSICKEFVEKHGGKLEIESDGSSYSKFIISIPLS